MRGIDSFNIDATLFHIYFNLTHELYKLIAYI
jgi:hypothetical protein